MPIYDSIGKQYSTTRIPDIRIAKKLIDLLNLPNSSIIADIGAGTGGYSQLIAVRGTRKPKSIYRKIFIVLARKSLLHHISLNNNNNS
ncbi:MAG: hypothetical protein ACKO11_02295 [Cuspidothrix sp.]